jgi:hypothetical protein
MVLSKPIVGGRTVMHPLRRTPEVSAVFSLWDFRLARWRSLWLPSKSCRSARWTLLAIYSQRLRFRPNAMSAS